MSPRARQTGIAVVDGSGADAALVGAQPAHYRYLHVLVTHHGRPNQSAYVGTWAYDRRGPGLRLELVNDIFYANAPGGFFAPASAHLSIRHTIFGDRGNDSLFGGSENDRIIGGTGLGGVDGDDSINGEAGNDALFGEHETLSLANHLHAFVRFRCQLNFVGNHFRFKFCTSR